MQNRNPIKFNKNSTQIFSHYAATLKADTKIFELNLKKLISKSQSNKIQQKFNADFLSLRCNFESWHKDFRIKFKEIKFKIAIQ
jgi:hypothetical protein